MTGDRAHFVATVREEGSEDERGPVATGLFSASAFDETDPAIDLDGPEGVSLDEALAWAREQASCVMVQYEAPEGAPGLFSAGERQCGRVRGMPEWPPAELDLRPRRHPEWLHVDRSADDEPIDWDVKVTVAQVWGDPVPELAEQMAARLSDLDGLDWIRLPGGGIVLPDPVPPGGIYFARTARPAAMFRFTVRGATVAEAEAAAEAICQPALGDTLADLSIPPSPEGYEWEVDAEAYPLGSRAAFNAAIRED